MKRREFIKKSAAFSALAATGLSSKGVFYDKTTYDLVAVRGNDPVAMFEKAITAMGGMKRFVKSGQTVVVKPNIGWDAIPERAANTNPQLVGRIVKHCVEAGAKSVLVFDHTANDMDKCYTNSGIEAEVKKAGGKMAGGNTESFYKDVAVAKGKSLKGAKVHELIINSDVFINVPILKHHGGAGLTIAMKNLMGIVWDRKFWHKNNLHQCIADFSSYRKPDLNIVDAYRVMMKNGPQGVSEDDVAAINAMVISPDIVAADAAATKLFGKEIDEVKYIGLAHDMGIGNKNLSELNIGRFKV